MTGAMKRWLAHRRLTGIVLAVVVLLYAPALRLGFILDDLTLEMMLRGRASVVIKSDPRFALFRFVTSDADVRDGMEVGFWPWWTTHEFRLAFFRPLSSLSHALDFNALKLPAWAMHVESLALYLLVVLVVAALARRLAGPVAAGVATLVFAFDDAHTMPVAWIANRNALFATLFGLLALLAYDRGVRDGAKVSRALGPLAFALALLSGEIGVAALAYLAAHALFVDARPRRERAWSLAPYAALVAVWTGLYKALGYGARAGSFYIDPGSEPLVFARALVVRLPALVGAQLGPLPADALLNDPEGLLSVLAIGGVVVVGLLAIVYRPLLSDRVARFGFVGMILALVPPSAVFPSDRSLLMSGLGGALVIGRIVEWTLESRRSLDRRLVTWGLFALHVVFASTLVPARIKLLDSTVGVGTRRAAEAFPPVDEAQTVVVLGAPDPLVLSYITSIRDKAGKPQPERYRLLSIAWHGKHVVRRVAPRAIEMTLSDGFLQDPIGQMFRAPSAKFRPGDEVALEGMRARVDEITMDGRPLRVTFTFDEPLEDPRYVVLTWKEKAFARVTLPPVGESLSFAPTPPSEAYAP